MLRFLSLLTRKLQSHKHSKREIKNFQKWKAEQNLPSYFCNTKKLLIIRLDDIGDYLLFRNMLCFYKRGRWKDYEITLLGNIAWKSFFDELDYSNVDKVVWVNKKQFLKSEIYRAEVCLRIRKEGFEVVVCPSRTRPLLLDDICMLATGATKKIASKNTFINKNWNKLSDNLYNELYKSDEKCEHEFIFNLKFNNWICDTNITLFRPEINTDNYKIDSNPYILCFIGASTRSKRWTKKQWKQFVKLYQQNYKGDVYIAGGQEDVVTADAISAKTSAKSIAGATTLEDMIRYVCNATCVITNDTMSAHLAVSCNVPAIIIANGNNYFRFAAYESAGINNVFSVYPARFTKQLTKKRGNLSDHFTAVTADINSISAEEVFSKYVQLIDNNLNHKKSST